MLARSEFSSCTKADHLDDLAVSLSAKAELKLHNSKQPHKTITVILVLMGPPNPQRACCAPGGVVMKTTPAARLGSLLICESLGYEGVVVITSPNDFTFKPMYSRSNTA